MTASARIGRVQLRPAQCSTSGSRRRFERDDDGTRWRRRRSASGTMFSPTAPISTRGHEEHMPERVGIRFKRGPLHCRRMAPRSPNLLHAVWTKNSCPGARRPGYQPPQRARRRAPKRRRRASDTSGAHACRRARIGVREHPGDRPVGCASGAAPAFARAMAGAYSSSSRNQIPACLCMTDATAAQFERRKARTAATSRRRQTASC